MRSATEAVAAVLESRPTGSEDLPVFSWLRVVRMHIERNVRVWLYFKVHAGLQLIQGVAQLMVFLYLGQLVGTAHFSSMAGGNYASYLVIGMVLLQLLDKSLIGPFVSLSGAYWSTRLESLMLSPYPIWLFVVSDTLWFYMTTSINAAAILVVGLVFDASFGTPQSWVMLFWVLFLGLVGVFGLGLMSASTFSLLNAKGREEPISWAIHLLQGLACGLYFPFALLPGALQAVGLVLPHTYAIDAVRRLFIAEYTSGATLPVHQLFELDPLLVNCFCLAAGAALYLPLGIYLFQRGLRKSQEIGTLSRWN